MPLIVAIAVWRNTAIPGEEGKESCVITPTSTSSLDHSRLAEFEMQGPQSGRRTATVFSRIQSSRPSSRRVLTARYNSRDPRTLTSLRQYRTRTPHTINNPGGLHGGRRFQ
ncbi:hypothetical protein J6590_005709 [Homalodisca vitripennis]|nr:hypothetical protein J6590_005709 [Homalodisca vitripennis]